MSELEKKKFDVFISYRRAGGANFARMMQQSLKARGYDVFLDFDSLRDGKFDENIYAAIDNCKVFILIPLASHSRGVNNLARRRGGLPAPNV